MNSPSEQGGAGGVGTATSDAGDPTSEPEDAGDPTSEPEDAGDPTSEPEDAGDPTLETEDAARAEMYRWSVPLRAVLTVVAGVCLPLTVWAVVRATQVPTPFPCGPETSGPPCPADVGALILGAAVTFVGAMFFGIVAAIMGATPTRLARRFGFLYLLAVLVGCVLAEPWADAVVRALT
ncbi:hypothetical protein [Cellulosimicrobium protaetiae]|uniref:Uncharacterized protein n=1 Tax=Cellulosimicrobium protaetiae TaxID=2587808 RepID=A0A6M5UGS2_9MICO|nr:hypothetical protein [Cellulosimicrobium protaetiae]QJW37284.1 hypothetical protein FIC82_014960 [Cellulosimicrobium protaetiae]